MDFKNLTTSTEYAVKGFYDYVYNLVPDEYRIRYENNEHVDCFREFYDQDLTFEDRLKYKATKIKYIDRRNPWVAIMWNTEGLQPADNHFRRYTIKIKVGETYHKGIACYVRMPMNIAIVSNSRTALDEFQEVFWLNVRPDDCAISTPHPIIEDFNVNIMDFNFNNTMKLQRTEGTLSMTLATAILQYPVIGGVCTDTGIIKSIHTYINEITDLGLEKPNFVLESFTILPDENLEENMNL